MNKTSSGTWAFEAAWLDGIATSHQGFRLHQSNQFIIGDPPQIRPKEFLSIPSQDWEWGTEYKKYQKTPQNKKKTNLGKFLELEGIELLITDLFTPRFANFCLI